jgi:hypothetical protein
LTKATIKLETTAKDLTFSHELLLKGKFDMGTFDKEEKVTHYFTHIYDITEQEMISENERKLTFHFQILIEPEVAEINFDGSFVLESSEQDKIDGLLEKNPRFLIDYLKDFILKQSYYHAEEIATSEGVPFPQANVILQSLGIF